MRMNIIFGCIRGINEKEEIFKISSFFYLQLNISLILLLQRQVLQPSYSSLINKQ